MSTRYRYQEHIESKHTRLTTYNSGASHSLVDVSFVQQAYLIFYVEIRLQSNDLDDSTATTETKTN